MKALLKLAIRDPLRSTGESYRRVTIAASRCPDCGFESVFDRAAHVVVCPNCHLALEPRPEGIRVRPYSCARIGETRLDGDYVPFWRYEFSLEMAGSAPITRLEDYARALFPQALPRGFAPRGPHLWVPAVRLLGTEFGDAAFQETRPVDPRSESRRRGREDPAGRILHGVAGHRERGRCAGGGGVRAARPARQGVGRALEHDAGDADGAQGEAHRREPAAGRWCRSTRAADGALHPPGSAVRIAPLLLRGGPELEAQRATVHRAARAMERPDVWPKMSF